MTHAAHDHEKPEKPSKAEVAEKPSMITVTVPFPTAKLGGSYNYQLAASSESEKAAPFTFTLQKNDRQNGLPPGVSLSASGLLSGIVNATAAPGLYTSTIFVTDSEGGESAVVAIIDALS